MLPSLEMLVNRHHTAYTISNNTAASTEALKAVAHWRNLVLAELKLDVDGLLLAAGEICIVYMGDTEIIRWNAMFQHIDMSRFDEFNFTITNSDGDVEIYQVRNGLVEGIASPEERVLLQVA